MRTWGKSSAQPPPQAQQGEGWPSRGSSDTPIHPAEQQGHVAPMSTQMEAASEAGSGINQAEEGLLRGPTRLYGPVCALFFQEARAPGSRL